MFFACASIFYFIHGNLKIYWRIIYFVLDFECDLVVFFGEIDLFNMEMDALNGMVANSLARAG